MHHPRPYYHRRNEKKNAHAITFSAVRRRSAVRAASSPSPDGLRFHPARAPQGRLDLPSSDALEGRLSLQRGSEIAIQWIASEFAKAGLKPLVGDSYLQPVPLIEFSADRALTSLTLACDGHSEVFHAPDATATFAHEITVPATWSLRASALPRPN